MPEKCKNKAVYTACRFEAEAEVENCYILRMLDLSSKKFGSYKKMSISLFPFIRGDFDGKTYNEIFYDRKKLT